MDYAVVVVGVGAGFVQRVGFALAWGQLGGDDALRAGKFNWCLDTTGLKIHRIVEDGRKVMSSRRDGLFARAALRCARWADKIVVFVWGYRASPSFFW